MDELKAKSKLAKQKTAISKLELDLKKYEISLQGLKN